MQPLRKLAVVMIVPAIACLFIIGIASRVSHDKASAASTSWNPAVSCVPVVTTIEAIVGTQTNANGGATQAGGWYGGQSIPDKTALTPPCTVNGAPMFVEIHNVNVEGMTCNSFTGGNDGDCWGNVWDNSTDKMTLLNQIHTEIAGTWIKAGTAPKVPATNAQIDIQGFVYWDDGHLGDAWHSYSGWELHPVSAWRPTTTDDFSLALSPTSGAVTGGSSTPSTLSTTVTGGSSQPLSLTATGLPAGATATFNPPTINSGGSSVVTLAASAGTPLGMYNIGINASGPSTSHTATYMLTVNGPSSTSIANGGFESGNLTAWTPAGVAAVTTSSPHTGSYAGMVGSTTATNGDSSISQSFTAPAAGGTLTFWYSINCQDTVSYDWGTAILADNTTGSSSTPLPNMCPSNTTWKSASSALTGGHYYTLSLINHDDNSGPDPTYTKFDDVAIQPNASLPAPTGLSATARSTSEIDLSWTGSAGATGYRVERSADGSSGWSAVGTPTGTSFADTGLNSATTYYYRVFATNSAGDSPPSTVVSATTPPNPPAAPTNLAASAASASEIDLSWTGSAGATGYRVERSADGSSGWSAVGTPTGTSFADTGLGAATTYYYRVFATNSGGASPASGVASATTGDGSPSRPTGLTVTNATASQVSLAWTDAAGETGYRIERSPDGSTGWAALGTVAANVTSYIDQTVNAGTTYYYRVFATNSAGDSPPSTVVSAITPPNPPAAPTNLAASAASASEIDLSWTGSAGATGYRVERSADGSSGWSAVGTPSGTSFADTGLGAATTYYYRVSATNPGGSSPPSTVASATTQAGAPPTPQSPRAAATSSSSITVSWLDVVSATSIQIQRSPDGSTSWTTVGTVGQHQASYTDTGLAAATTYWYRLVAANAAGTSSPSATVSATTNVAPCPCTAWPASAAPKLSAAPDTTANELGVKFRVDVAGAITGLRFYKGATNTGTHVGHLWSRTGTLLATATFTGETATGWQQVNFASPVTVVPGTTYVASYYAPAGHYAADQNYFATQGVDSGPIHMLASGIDGVNGVYRQGVSGFPTWSYRASNYWVDVVFSASPTGPPTAAASAQPAGQVTITWGNVAGATSYAISWSSDGASGWTVIGSTAATATAWADIRPAPGVANYYRVTAVSWAGTSPPSNVVSAIPSG